ncbi:hypothetical protein [Sphingomonas koreensis]
MPLDHFAPVDASGAELDIRVSRVAALAERAPLTAVRRGHVYADGTRFPWEREAVFDSWSGNRVDYLPGPGWKGMLPHAFYGTVAAHVLAWRGLIPLHACAVEIGGRAVLIAGTGGAGKSSLMAGLLARGAALVSDDLTALEIHDGVAEALPGRTTIRIGDAVAAWVEGARYAGPSSETRDKHVIRPARRTQAERLPLAALLVLGETPGTLPPAARARAFAKHLFRPAWLAALPGRRERQQALLALAAQVPVIGFPARKGDGEAEHFNRADRASALVAAL